MKRILLLVLFCIMLPGGVQITEVQSAELFRIGISHNTLGTINPNDYMAAFKSWVMTVSREQGLQVQAQTQVFDTNKILHTAYRQNIIDAISLTVEDLMFLDVQPESIFVAVKEGKIHIKYSVIVHRDSDIRSVEELKGKTVATHEGNDMALARQWLEVLLSSHAKGSSEDWLENLTITKKPSKSILQVFFRQSYAALITQSTFELACELNPQLKKGLKVLAVSPPLIPNLFFFRSTYQTKARKKIENAITKLHTTAGGRQVLSIFKSDRLEKQGLSILDSTLQFLREYQQLMGDKN